MSFLAANSETFKIHGMNQSNEVISILKHLISDIIPYFIAPRLKLNMDNGDFYDFHDFFNLFLETQVCNLRECLSEWLIRARGTVNRAQTMKNTAQSVLLAADINTNTGGAKEIALTECITVEK